MGTQSIYKNKIKRRDPDKKTYAKTSIDQLGIHTVISHSAGKEDQENGVEKARPKHGRSLDKFDSLVEEDTSKRLALRRRIKKARDRAETEQRQRLIDCVRQENKNGRERMKE